MRFMPISCLHIVVLGCFVFAAAPLAFAQSEPLDLSADWELSEGTAVISGRLGMTPTMLRLNDESTWGTQLVISPGARYFISDDISLNGAFGVTTGVGKLYEASATTVVFGVGLTKYFETKGKILPFVNPYFGFEKATATDGSLSTFTWGVNGGVLYRITQSVGIEAGISVSSLHFLDDVGGWVLSFPMGVINILAFI